MPRVIATDDAAPIGVDELIDTIETARWDARDEDSFASLGPALARLGRNATFLGDLAIDALERGFAGEAQAYGAQSLLLAAPRSRYLLRANFWPAASDAVVRASGAGAFFYDHAHDHNFSFLTTGHLGPGYWSDYYAHDGPRDLAPGDAANLTFVERSRLAPGRTLLYRAHRDVHVQHPPDAFSVSLNILAYDPAQIWRSQYRFDVAQGRVAEVLTTAASEALVAVAVAFAGAEGAALAQEMARRHPSPRMRATAAAALAALAPERSDSL